ncbi:MAG: methylenetetrahydrofolate reductase C-terminal domain-containing protein [Actinobacteria bacterium]|nr:methylenetetrahydrofolate reductase C-terminal domain-containing protein [Actinomycetota bacterium]MBU1944081.1 methylenetetrahydrofolate reductase C-terminal domain-containing protein [Actinomycetota bacterium]MBU2687265.1 methylenetetrahydrofolate reductase C-terminal domain-containing protein [Actinomycetota bacterium]
MIVTRKKPFEAILKELEDAGSVFLIGCADCATVAETGGEDQIKEMTEKLTAEGKEVTGNVIPETGCHELDVKKEFRAHKEEVGRADAILCMSCGAGCQSARDATEKPVYPANDSIFLGNVMRVGQFEEKCRLCGDCVLDLTGGICPVTRCHKGILNGPCGGTNEGKCEVDPEKDCAWTLIYQQLEREGKLDRMRAIQAPKNWGPVLKPGRHVLERDKGGE